MGIPPGARPHAGPTGIRAGTSHPDNCRSARTGLRAADVAYAVGMASAEQSLAALLRRRLVAVFTPGSTGRVEDGPRHPAVEQTTGQRLIPNRDAGRPCDKVETLSGRASAPDRRGGPTSLQQSRQLVPLLRSATDAGHVRRGGRVSRARPGGAARSALSVSARARRAQQGVPVRVVSMPSITAFGRDDISCGPLVASHFNRAPSSSIFESTLTKVSGRLVKVSGWTDNEWGLLLPDAGRHGGADGCALKRTPRSLRRRLIRLGRGNVGGRTPCRRHSERRLSCRLRASDRCPDAQWANGRSTCTSSAAL